MRKTGIRPAEIRAALVATVKRAAVARRAGDTAETEGTSSDAIVVAASQPQRPSDRPPLIDGSNPGKKIVGATVGG